MDGESGMCFLVCIGRMDWSVVVVHTWLCRRLAYARLAHGGGARFPPHAAYSCASATKV